MLKETFCICYLIVCINAMPAPNPDMDPATMAVMASGKAIDLFETGMAHSKDIASDMMKTSENTALGMADVIKRHRRAITALKLGNTNVGGHGSGRRHIRSSENHSASSSSLSSSSSSDYDE